MIKTKTYDDFLKVAENEQEKQVFMLSAIQDHKASEEYRIAMDADLYLRGQNVTIGNYRKLLYTMTGKSIPDNYSANHKCARNFFNFFITQETAYEVGNGVTFEQEQTKEKLGKNIDAVLYRGVKNALTEGVSFGFMNDNQLEIFKFTEFVPLYEEETGLLRAGIRFWQLDTTKPLRMTLFEEDGFTEYLYKETKFEILKEKSVYKYLSIKTKADGEIIEPLGNYDGFPIVPLYGNLNKTSELVGRRQQIDCYDLIKSGFANDLDDASMIYWTLENAGGMDDIDLAKFLDRMRTVRAAVVKDDGAKATAHTMEVPYQSREVYLNRLEVDLYKDFMALNTEAISAGNVTATQIQAAYEPLNEKCDELEMCLCDFFNGILKLLGVEDTPTFERSRVVNQLELTNMILAAATYLDDETILKKLPFLTSDEIDGILKRKDAEEADRYKMLDDEGNDDKNEEMVE